MAGAAAELAHRLAREAEAVCRHYLSNGRRVGHYWVVGDVANTPGRSLYVRLHGRVSGRGAAGKWTDAATGEHGDLLELIARNRGLDRLSDVLDEARSFLFSPRATIARWSPVPSGSPEAARRLFQAGRPVPGTLAEVYLRGRAITAAVDWPCLRFHQSVYYRTHDTASREAWPALLAAVTDGLGRITGVQRTWLDPNRPGKAPLVNPRRALGRLLGNGVRFGVAHDVVAVGEGIETMLALKAALPALPMIAGLSATHLAALVLPTATRRLYIARDKDTAGAIAMERLRTRAGAQGIEVHALVPVFDDTNTDLMHLGVAALLSHVAAQLHPTDRARFCG